MPKPTSNPQVATGRASRFDRHWRTAAALAGMLAVFMLLAALFPLRTTVQLGGDEGFELAKATLCLKGFKLYNDVWNDQPRFTRF